MQWRKKFSQWATKAQTTKTSSSLSISAPRTTANLSVDHVTKVPRDTDGHLVNTALINGVCESVPPIGKGPVCQIMSDLHLEWRGYEEFKITREAPNLLLVGDIGRFCDYDRFLGFLRRQCEIFDHVLLVPSNHEFYGSSRQEGLEVGAKFERELGEKFIIMHRRRVDLHNGEVVVLGCTLHSHIAKNYTALTNDFARIKDWRVRNHNEEHAIDLAWLERSLTEVNESTSQSRVVITTHYAPAFEKTAYQTHENSNLSPLLQ